MQKQLPPHAQALLAFGEDAADAFDLLEAHRPFIDLVRSGAVTPETLNPEADKAVGEAMMLCLTLVADAAHTFLTKHAEADQRGEAILAKMDDAA